MMYADAEKIQMACWKDFNPIVQQRIIFTIISFNFVFIHNNLIFCLYLYTTIVIHTLTHTEMHIYKNISSFLFYMKDFPLLWV